MIDRDMWTLPVNHVLPISILVADVVALSVPSSFIGAYDRFTGQNSSNLLYTGVMNTSTVANYTLGESNSTSYNSSRHHKNGFPPEAWLGYGLDLTQPMPLDIDSATSAVIKSSRVIQLNDKTSTTQIPGTADWDVPIGVLVTIDARGAKTSYNSFKDGATAARALVYGGSLEASYKVILQADASLDRSVEENYQDFYQYGMFSSHAQLVQASITDYGDAINEEVLRDYVDKLARFDQTDTAIVQDYKLLFQLLGTHIIIEVSYGSRLSLVGAWSYIPHPAILITVPDRLGFQCRLFG